MKVFFNMERIMGTLNEGLSTFLMISQFFLECDTFQRKVLGKIGTHILFSLTLFWKSCCLSHIVKNRLEADKPQMTM
jgi:hypothetical protein